jgi:3-methyladenine DNA glycosylase/8-oxoguanine DNA glycosylase
VRRTLNTPSDFSFRSAVCSHGFFVLAPNVWDPTHNTLDTVVTVNADLAARVRLSESTTGKVTVRCDGQLTSDACAAVISAVRRILRLDEDLTAFHEMCRRKRSHEAAARMRFGRLIRSASLFEDIVKVICTCNVTWRQTTAMIAHIVDHWGVPTRDGRRKGFPTPERLARVSANALRRIARVGYRAAFIHRLARDVVAGKMNLDGIEHFDGSSDALYRRLRKIHGVGDYAAGHLCMLLGHHDRLAIDTEMMRFLKTRHPRKRFTPARIREYYDAWHPYQFLAYWFELWQDYIQRHGDADQWQPNDIGRSITSS